MLIMDRTGCIGHGRRSRSPRYSRPTWLIEIHSNVFWSSDHGSEAGQDHVTGKRSGGSLNQDHVLGKRREDALATFPGDMINAQDPHRRSVVTRSRTRPSSRRRQPPHPSFGAKHLAHNEPAASPRLIMRFWRSTRRRQGPIVHDQRGWRPASGGDSFGMIKDQGRFEVWACDGGGQGPAIERAHDRFGRRRESPGRLPPAGGPRSSWRRRVRRASSAPVCWRGLWHHQTSRRRRSRHRDRLRILAAVCCLYARVAR